MFKRNYYLVFVPFDHNTGRHAQVKHIPTVCKGQVYDIRGNGYDVWEEYEEEIAIDWYELDRYIYGE